MSPTSTSRRRPVRTAAVLAVLASGTAAAPDALAQEWPSRPLRVIIPYPAGDTGDVIVRLISSQLAQRLGQPVVADNRAGASGQVGLELAARAQPDGHTLSVGQAGNVAAAPHTARKLGYDPLRDFAPIALVARNHLALAVHPSTPYRTVPELISWAKSNPGKLTFGSNGEGGFPHLSFELFRVQAGFTYLHVPYKGSGPAVADVIGGQVNAVMAAYTTLAAHARAGKVRMLAITHDARMSAVPDVPTIGEFVPGYSSHGWFGFLGPAGLPAPIVNRLNEEINRAVRLPEIAERMTAAGLDAVTEPPKAFGELIRAEHAKYGKLTRAIGFKPQ
jgi:tripartite-type tricarboxylate transporter receptor subunit TctC